MVSSARQTWVMTVIYLIALHRLLQTHYIMEKRGYQPKSHAAEAWCPRLLTVETVGLEA